MAESGDLHCITPNIGTVATTGGTAALIYIPASHGAITITSARLLPMVAAGTIVTFELMKLTNAATPAVGAAGTLGTLPTSSGTIAANGMVALTMATNIVSPGTAGCFLGFAIKGTLIAPVRLSINYIMGRNG